MYLSEIRLNLRSRDVHRDLSNIYELHRTLLRGFPNMDAGGPGRVLYRVEPSKHGSMVPVLVQSEKEPDWDFLEEMGPYLSEPVKSKEFDPHFVEGQVLSFRLKCNPTVKRNGKRLGLLKDEEQMDWLKRKAKLGGFQVVQTMPVPEGFSKTVSGKKKISFYSVRFDGILRVEDPEAFLATLKNGIGSAKGFGFGLLSIAPSR